jgi:hypothetical protein
MPKQLVTRHRPSPRGNYWRSEEIRITPNPDWEVGIEEFIDTLELDHQELTRSQQNKLLHELERNIA